MWAHAVPTYASWPHLSRDHADITETLIGDLRSRRGNRRDLGVACRLGVPLSAVLELV